MSAQPEPCEHGAEPMLCIHLGCQHFYFGPVPTWHDVAIHDHAQATYAELLQILCTRHQKYGPGNISAAPGGPLNGLRVRIADKLARINHAIDTDAQLDYADDSFRDAWLDLANYAVIGMLVLDGKWPE